MQTHQLSKRALQTSCRMAFLPMCIVSRSSEVSSISSCPSFLLFLLLPTCLVVLSWGPTHSLSFHFYSCKALGACDTCRDTLAHTRPHHPDLPASSVLHIHTASRSHRIVSSAAPSPPENLTSSARPCGPMCPSFWLPGLMLLVGPHRRRRCPYCLFLVTC